jgi:hypothetical protein
MIGSLRFSEAVVPLLLFFMVHEGIMAMGEGFHA